MKQNLLFNQASALSKRLAMVLTMLLTIGIGTMWGADTWTLVKDASDLAVGDEVVIAASGSDYALGTTQNDNNRAAVSITKNGDNITWTTAVQVLTLEAGKTSSTFALHTENGYLYAASSSKNYLRTETTLSDNSSWSISIDSEGVATIQAQGTNTRNLLKKNSQSAIFSCYGSGQSDVAIYKKQSSGSTSVAVTGVTLDQTSLDLTIGDKVTLTATISPDNATNKNISWSSDNPTVADVDEEGLVTAVTAGTATITVTSEDGNKRATCTATVSAPAGGGEECTWTLITNASDLNAGDKVVIAAKDYSYAISTTQNGNNRGQASVTKNTSNNTITFGDDVQILTLEEGNTSGTLAFYTGNGYLYAASSGSNYMRTETTLSDNSSWEITIADDGTATVVAQGTNTRNTMQYNQSSSIFSCYGSASQKAIVIYKEVCTGGSTETLGCLPHEKAQSDESGP